MISLSLSTHVTLFNVLLFFRNPATHDIQQQFAVTRADARAVQYGDETSNKQVTFREPVSNNESDDPDTEGQQNEGEPSANWGTTALDDPGSSYSPYLPPVLEEPTSSFSEGEISLVVGPFSLLEIVGHLKNGYAVVCSCRR